MIELAKKKVNSIRISTKENLSKSPEKKSNKIRKIPKVETEISGKKMEKIEKKKCLLEE